MLKSKRHKRNINDMKNVDTNYPFIRFGTKIFNKRKYSCDYIPSQHNADILGWDYSSKASTTIFRIISNQKNE